MLLANTAECCLLTLLNVVFTLAGPSAGYLGGGGVKGKRGAKGTFDEHAELERQKHDNDTDDEDDIPPEVLSVLEEDKFITAVSALLLSGY